VAGGVAIHLVDGLGEALDRLLERGLEVFVEARVLDRGGGARGDDGEELALAFVEALAPGDRGDGDEAEEALLDAERDRDQRREREARRFSEEARAGGAVLEERIGAEVGEDLGGIEAPERGARTSETQLSATVSSTWSSERLAAIASLTL
jgi:hypothetical protein